MTWHEEGKLGGDEVSWGGGIRSKLSGIGWGN